MFKNAVFFAASALGLAVLAPQYLPGLAGVEAPRPPRADPRAAPQPVATAAPAAATASADDFREKSIPADSGGQYSVDALIAGQSVHMLVDTGATMVVISAALADRLGLSPSGPRLRVHTANGDAAATPTVLPSIDLGSIYMNDVQALIADRSAGDVSLLGASFLKRLASVEQRNGMLILRQ